MKIAADRPYRELLKDLGALSRPFSVAGTPKVVADEIERWIDEAGVDGFNLIQHLTPGTAVDFAELVVPELRRRGLYRTAYNDGETLRERMHGAGRPRLDHRHPGARFRDLAALRDGTARSPSRADHGGSPAPSADEQTVAGTGSRVS